MIDRRKFLLGLAATPVAFATAPALKPTTVRVKLPSVQWRLLYKGVPIRVVDDLTQATIERDISMLWGDPSKPKGGIL